MTDYTGATSSQTSTGASPQGSARDTSRIIDKVRDTARAQLTSQKNRATDGLGSISQAVRQSTHQLRDQEHDVVAHYVEQAADQIDRFSQQLRNKDVGDLMQDVQRMARRRPALFISGAFAVGLIGARFFKSSSSTASDGRARGNVAMGMPSDYDSNRSLPAGSADVEAMSESPSGVSRPSSTRSRRSGPSARS